MLDVIGCILEDQDSLYQFSHIQVLSVTSYSASSIITESRTNIDNQHQQYDPTESGFDYLYI